MLVERLALPGLPTSENGMAKVLPVNQPKSCQPAGRGSTVALDVCVLVDSAGGRVRTTLHPQAKWVTDDRSGKAVPAE